MMLEDLLGADNITHILYTPLEAIYAYLNKERSIAGVACGTDDQVIASIGDPSDSGKAMEKEADEKAAADKKAAEEKAAKEKAAKEKAAEKKPPPEEGCREAAKKAGKIVLLRQRTSASSSPDKGSDKLIEEMMEIWLQSNVTEQSFIPKKYWSKNYKEVLRVMSIASVYI